MGAVICILELWLFFWQLDKYVIPKWDILGAQVIDSIILMAQKLWMRTLFESVETKEQSEFLGSAGCEMLQGYLFGKAIPYDEFDGNFAEGEIIVSGKIL